MISPAGSGDFPVDPDPAVCPARFEDCWCGETSAHPGVAHMCAAPGCGALWTHDGDVLRIPGSAKLRRERRRHLEIVR